MYFRIYGDCSNRLWREEEVKNYFNIINTKHNKYAQCVKNLKGSFNHREYYVFKVGDLASVFKASTGIYLIR